jgi:hypothetical protein
MSWAELVEAAEAIRLAAVDLDPRLRAAPLAGIGWATVDHERAQDELDGLLAGDPAAPSLAPWDSVGRDPVLGAAAWQRAPDGAAPAPLPSLVLLEPDTEGRIAAFLARFGEGVGAIYLGDRPPRAGEVLRGGPAWGPHVVILDGPR